MRTTPFGSGGISITDEILYENPDLQVMTMFSPVSVPTNRIGTNVAGIHVVMRPCCDELTPHLKLRAIVSITRVEIISIPHSIVRTYRLSLCSSDMRISEAELPISKVCTFPGMCGTMSGIVPGVRVQFCEVFRMGERNRCITYLCFG